MLVYIQSVIAIILGIISSITDFKDKKILNKYIIASVVLSTIVYIIFWKQITYEYIVNYIINLVISLIISFSFFYFKIWAAGDAKLFLAIVYMIPFDIYETNTHNIFPAIYLMIMIFGIAFLYVFFETIYLWIKDKNKIEKIKISTIKRSDVYSFLLQYFMGYFVILLINNITLKFFGEFRLNNSGLILILNMLILIYLYRIIKNINKMKIVNLIFVVLNVFYYIIFGFELYSVNIKMLLIVLLIIAFRTFSEKYNYEEINVQDLKPRMILSYGSILSFYGSRVKGLPQNTTETTDSRLREDEVESIKRWSKTAKGKDKITIVRHMPFAPFMLLGEVLFFILKLYV